MFDLERKLVAPFACRPEVDVVALFGSVAAGRLGRDSDVDLYVRLRPEARWSTAQRNALAAEAARSCGRDVDLVVEDERTSVILRREVAGRGRPLYEARRGAWTDLRAAALLAYADLEPYMRRIGRAIRRAAV
jgi:predicted nucleotidyltransferase